MAVEHRGLVVKKGANGVRGEGDDTTFMTAAVGMFYATFGTN